MHHLIKWAAIPTLAIAMLFAADSQQAKAQFGINIGVGSFGYGPGFGSGFGPGFGAGYPRGFTPVNRYSALSFGAAPHRHFNNSYRASSYAFPSYRSSYYRAPVQLYSVPVRPVYGRGGRGCY